MYLTTGESDDGVQLATNTGWGLVGDWIDGLDAATYPDVIHLWEHGWTEPVSALRRQLVAAVGVDPPDQPDALKTVRELAASLDDLPGDAAVSVTDGMGPDEEETTEATAPTSPALHLFAAMLQAAADDDHDAVSDLAALAADPDALAELVASLGGTVSEAWSAFQTKRGTQGAVNDGGTKVYGARARALLAAQARADKGEPAPETPQAKAKRLAGEREPARVEARTAFGAAMADPAGVKAEHFDALRDHLHTLTRDEARTKLRELGQRTGGKLKAEIVEGLLAHVRGQADGATPADVRTVLGDHPAAGAGRDDAPTFQPASKPDPAPAKPKAAKPPAWVSSDPQHAAAADHYARATGAAKSVIETALDNAGYLRRDPTTDAVTGFEKDAPEDADAHHRYAAGLAAGHRQMLDHGLGTPADVAHVEAALESAGAERVDSADGGFDGQLHAAYPGVFTGHPVRVTKPGWVVTRPGGGADVVKAAVEPAGGAQPAAPAPAGAPGPADSGNSPKNPSPTVDNGKEIGDTTPVPATPAGGSGGKVMTTHDELIDAVAHAAGGYKDGAGRPVVAKVWRPEGRGSARVYIRGKKDHGYIEVHADGTVDSVGISRERKDLSNHVAAALGFDYGEGYTHRLPVAEAAK